MKPITFWAILLALPLAVASCMKEDNSTCSAVTPATGRVLVGIQDKNYENARDAQIAALIAPADENAPLATWLKTLTVWDHVQAGYNRFQQSLTAGVVTQPLDATKFVDGVNVITAIGNGDYASLTYGESQQTAALHPGNDEYGDIYIASSQVTLPLPQDYELMLTRAKGLLALDIQNLPAQVRTITLSVTDVYATVDGSLNYAGNTQVVKTYDMSSTGMPLKLLLAPTAAPAAASPLTITLNYENGQTSVLGGAVATIVRNRITLLRPIYDPSTGQWEISSQLVDGSWSSTTDLTLI